jgi:hypothetical protein
MALGLCLPWVLLIAPPLFWFLRVIAPSDAPGWLVDLVSWGGMAGFLLVSLAAGVASAFYNSVSVAPDGLTAFSFWAFIRTTVPWSSITSVKSSRYLGLPYLRLIIQGTASRIWLPRFLHRQADFDRAVLSVAPQDNPLRATLECHGRTANGMSRLTTR